MPALQNADTGILNPQGGPGGRSPLVRRLQSSLVWLVTLGLARQNAESQNTGTGILTYRHSV